MGLTGAFILGVVSSFLLGCHYAWRLQGKLDHERSIMLLKALEFNHKGHHVHATEAFRIVLTSLHKFAICDCKEPPSEP